ncbi:hypothetical protein [Pseudosulfitobacter sp. SM2401]|uniref:hypothetical protein n=1 Tax=Pseudosulfitobacter sp. SM2401 TaxID=3350098 RepID=UPI0036F1B983
MRIVLKIAAASLLTHTVCTAAIAKEVAVTSSECVPYDAQFINSKKSIELARSISENLPDAKTGSMANARELAVYISQRAEIEGVDRDPLFFLAWSYRTALMTEYGPSLGLSEAATGMLLGGRFCEEATFLALIASLRFQVVGEIKGTPVPGYKEFGTRLHYPPIDFGISDFDAAVCWMQNLENGMTPPADNWRYLDCRKNKK